MQSLLFLVVAELGLGKTVSLMLVSSVLFAAFCAGSVAWKKKKQPNKKPSPTPPSSPGPQQQPRVAQRAYWISWSFWASGYLSLLTLSVGSTVPVDFCCTLCLGCKLKKTSRINQVNNWEGKGSGLSDKVEGFLLVCKWSLVLHCRAFPPAWNKWMRSSVPRQKLISEEAQACSHS